ncbi:hypothetical protein VU12_08800, partial [Desulfobulbus sp. US4]|nr:hypothetical protein [Desulfobulbus sp. US4]
AVGSIIGTEIEAPVHNGRELWKSDGTEAGTVIVKDIYAGLTGSNPNYLTVVDGRLYFSADNGANGRELWAYVPKKIIGWLPAVFLLLVP